MSPPSEAMELLAGDALHLLARAPPLPYPNRRSCWVVVVPHDATTHDERSGNGTNRFVIWSFSRRHAIKGALGHG